MKASNCRKCGEKLTGKNWSASASKKHDYICKECNIAQLRENLEGFEYSKDCAEYSIDPKRHTKIPKINIKGEDTHNPTLIAQMVKDTEKFRVDKMMQVMKTTDDVAVKYEAIMYLLKSFDSLTTKQCAEVVNNANLMFGNKLADSKIAVKLARALKMFVGEDKKKADNRTYEQLRKSAGTLEVEIPE